MATAPMCKFCHTRHWGTCNWKSEEPKIKPPPKKLNPPNDSKSTKPSNKSTLYKHNCQWCGKSFKGSHDRIYCSNNCRLTAWRKKNSNKPISWGRKRFSILQRDKFKCTYCGRSANDGYVLHVDHIHPKSKGGTDDIENLTTACMECNLGKSDNILDYNP